MKRVRPSLPQRPATGAMPVRWHAAAAIAVIAGALGAPAAAELQAAPYGAPVRSERVEVSYRDPARLTELGRIPITANESAAWIDSLSKYIATRAERVVPAGQRLVVTINDVKRAGGFEPGRPGRAGEVRIVRDSSPPWIDLSFRME